MENGYVRQATCHAVHSGISEDLMEIKLVVKGIGEELAPLVQKHEVWIAGRQKALDKGSELSWKIWLLIIGAIALPYVKSGIDFLIRLRG